MILKKVVIFLKCYVKIKTLGSTFQEPIYEGLRILEVA